MPTTERRRRELQRQANEWLRRFRTQGLEVPSRVRVYTNQREFDRAIGMRRWERLQLLDEARGRFNGEAHTSEHCTKNPAIWVNTNFQETRKHPHRIVIHEMLHHISPPLPHWKVYALERELTAGRIGRRVWRAKSREAYRNGG